MVSAMISSRLAGVQLSGLTIDANGNVGLSTSQPLLTLDSNGSARVKGTATSVLTGSIDPIASTAVTGVNTLFLTELVPGDRITASGETRTVVSIASDTSLTVDTAFSNNANDTSPDRLRLEFVVTDSSDNVDFIIQDTGNVGIGTISPSSPLHVETTASGTTFGSNIITTLFSQASGRAASLRLGDGTNQAMFLSYLNGGAAPRLGIGGSAEYLSILQSGNIGINTIGPDRRLDILDASAPQLRLTQTDGSVYADFQVDSNGDLIMGVDGTTNQLVLDNGGSVGIGTAAPGHRLDVVGGSIRTDADIHTGDLYLGYDDASATITTTDTNEALTIDPNGSGAIFFHGSTYNIDSSGNITAQKFFDSANSTYFIDPATSGTAISLIGGSTILFGTGGTGTISTSGTDNLILNAGGTVVIGDGTGKLDAGTIDPPYTINGVRYATYHAAMTGVKEETTGTIATNTYVAGIGYRATIDFAQVSTGSDLWLFSKSTDLRSHINDLVVLLSPSGNARAWYTIDPEAYTLTIYTTRPAVVSYRLTAPRFDAANWSNERNGQHAGFRLNDGEQLALTSSGEVIGEDGTPLDDLLIVESGEPMDATPFDLRTASGEVITEVIALSEAVIANIRSGFVFAEYLAAYAIDAATARVGSLTAVNRIASPIVETDELRTNLLSPLGSESEGIAVQLAPEQTFGIINQNNEPVATFDDAGNATLAGELTANSIQTNELAAQQATISGNLFADRIRTSFGDLDTRLEEITASVAAIPALPPDDGLDATSSALLAMLLGEHIAPDSTATDLIVDSNLITRGNFSVYGDTLLGRTTIGGTLLIDASLFISGSSIDTIGDTLYLQQNRLGPVDILDGTLTVDLLGNVVINGNLAISGNLNVGGVLGVNTINIAGPDATQSAFGRLAFLGANGQEVASINASGSAAFAGDVTASGSGTFSKLFITERPPESTGSASQATAGTGILTAGQTEVLVETSQVTSNSLIYVTPLSSTSNQILYVRQKVAGAGFSVAIDLPVFSDITFNWWIIN